MPLQLLITDRPADDFYCRLCQELIEDGQIIWFDEPTQVGSHVECTPAEATGRVPVDAGPDWRIWQRDDSTGYVLERGVDDETTWTPASSMASALAALA